MDSQKQNMRAKEVIQENTIQQPPQPPPSGSGGVLAAAASPPSSSSSPSHEFSFTISLNPTNNPTKSPVLSTNKTTKPSSFAIDLSPADEIFFHGHLLPLHLLSHLPISPRTSTNSIDTSLPIIQEPQNTNTKLNHDYDINDSYYDLNHSFRHQETTTKVEKPKSKSFFGLAKWRKGEKEDKEKQRKLKFDQVSQVLKRYMKMVRPFLSFRSRKNMDFHRTSYSYSGNLSFRGKKEIRGIKRGAYSAPVSMKNSPTNSGLLVAKPEGGYNCNSSSSSDSTMEELQAAIQAAIAHCKKSSAVDEKNQVTRK